jgi:hypothetical protein
MPFVQSFIIRFRPRTVRTTAVLSSYSISCWQDSTSIRFGTKPLARHLRSLQTHLLCIFLHIFHHFCSHPTNIFYLLPPCKPLSKFCFREPAAANISNHTTGTWNMDLNEAYHASPYIGCIPHTCAFTFDPVGPHTRRPSPPSPPSCLHRPAHTDCSKVL